MSYSTLYTTMIYLWRKAVSLRKVCCHVILIIQQSCMTENFVVTQQLWEPRWSGLLLACQSRSNCRVTCSCWWVSREQLENNSRKPFSSYKANLVI